MTTEERTEQTGTYDPTKDALVTIEGGCVQSVNLPPGADYRVVVIDFDIDSPKETDEVWAVPEDGAFVFFNVIGEDNGALVYPELARAINGDPKPISEWGGIEICCDCGDQYPGGGDGYAGRCPVCADKAEETA